jgi:hypothetical protein
MMLNLNGRTCAPVLEILRNATPPFDLWHRYAARHRATRGVPSRLPSSSLHRRTFVNPARTPASKLLQKRVLCAVASMMILARSMCRIVLSTIEGKPQFQETALCVVRIMTAPWQA